MSKYFVVLGNGCVTSVPEAEKGNLPILAGPFPSWKVAIRAENTLEEVLRGVRSEAAERMAAEEEGYGMVRVPGILLKLRGIELPRDTKVTCHWTELCPKCGGGLVQQHVRGSALPCVRLRRRRRSQAVARGRKRMLLLRVEVSFLKERIQ